MSGKNAAGIITNRASVGRVGASEAGATAVADSMADFFLRKGLNIMQIIEPEQVLVSPVLWSALE